MQVLDSATGELIWTGRGMGAGVRNSLGGKGGRYLALDYDTGLGYRAATVVDLVTGQEYPIEPEGGPAAGDVWTVGSWYGPDWCFIRLYRDKWVGTKLMIFSTNKGLSELYPELFDLVRQLDTEGAAALAEAYDYAPISLLAGLGELDGGEARDLARLLISGKSSDISSFRQEIDGYGLHLSSWDAAGAGIVREELEKLCGPTENPEFEGGACAVTADRDTQDMLWSRAVNGHQQAQDSVTHLPVVRLDTAGELEEFTESFGPGLLPDYRYQETQSFNDLTGDCGDEYFEKNCLLITWVRANMSTSRCGVISVPGENGILTLRVIETTGSQAGDYALQDWLIVVRLPKETADGYREIHAYVMPEDMK